ncbi:unnamed protein product [Caretta caretta]
MSLLATSGEQLPIRAGGGGAFPKRVFVTGCAGGGGGHKGRARGRRLSLSARRWLRLLDGLVSPSRGMKWTRRAAHFHCWHQKDCKSLIQMQRL